MSSFRPKPAKPPSLELIQQNEFEGYYRHVTHQSEDGTFKIVIFRAAEGEEFKARGNLYGIGQGEPIRIKGQWREHATYGWTFQIETVLSIAPTSTESVLAWLGSGLIKGVRLSTAQKIVDHFGDRTLEVLDSAPELLREVKGITKGTIRKIVDQWEAQRATREVMLFLKGLGLSNAMSTRLIKFYGENAAAVLKLNPYQAGLDVPLIGFSKADEIATKLGIEKSSPLRVQAAFVHLLEMAGNEGHTHLPREALVERSLALLNVDRSLVEECLGEAVRQKYITTVELANGGECYFNPVLYRFEWGLQKLVAGLSAHARGLVSTPVDERIAEFENHYHFQLAPLQQDAIRAAAMAGGVVIITGGPGTGKTTLVRALLHVMQGTGARFALCSPTGRAAQRLSETTGQEAATVHRLLKWNGQTGRFTYGPDQRLPIDLLIVDESSMLDVPLAFNLLSALHPGTTVVFVGDVDQLPSVGPGTFLRDMIASGRATVVRLQVIFRQGRQSLIIENSHRINTGQTPLFAEPGDKNADFFFVSRDEPEGIREAMIAMATERIPNRLGCDPIDGVQVLAPMRVGALGTVELNKLLQDKLNRDGRPLFEGSRFRDGDKVIQSTNNYDLDVYNGDVGRIAGYNSETRQVRIQFGRRTVFYPLENVDELELAYAITIHKSQGSEYPAVVLLMHTSHFIMLKRNLLYTGVTRGKRLVVVIGSRRALFQAIRTSGESERMTALGEWLARPGDREELVDG